MMNALRNLVRLLALVYRWHRENGFEPFPLSKLEQEKAALMMQRKLLHKARQIVILRHGTMRKWRIVKNAARQILRQNTDPSQSTELRRTFSHTQEKYRNDQRKSIRLTKRYLRLWNLAHDLQYIPPEWKHWTLFLFHNHDFAGATSRNRLLRSRLTAVIPPTKK